MNINSLIKQGSEILKKKILILIKLMQNYYYQRQLKKIDPFFSQMMKARFRQKLFLII